MTTSKSGVIRSLEKFKTFLTGGGIFLVLLVFALFFFSCKSDGKPADLAWNNMIEPHAKMLDMGVYKMRVIDKGQGAPLLLIHGFADSAYCWHNNIQALNNAGFRTIAVEYPGLGGSTIPPKDYVFSIDHLAEDILRAADMLGLKKFSVAGNSMGGGITLYLGIFHPDRLEKAIPIDPASYPQEPPGLLNLMNHPTFGSFAQKFAGKGTVRISLLDCYADRTRVSKVMVDEYARPLAKEGYVDVLARLLKEYGTHGAPTLAQKYNEIKVPTLILWGDTDRWVPTKFADRLHKDIPDSQLRIIKNAGHLPHQERPEIVNPIIIDFLKGKEAAPMNAATFMPF